MASDQVSALRAEYARHKLAGRTDECERIEKEIQACGPETTAQRSAPEKAVTSRPKKK